MSLVQPAHLKVPKENRSWLRSPSEAQAAELVFANAGIFRSVEIDVGGTGLTELRAWSRREVFAAAQSYMARWDGSTSWKGATESANWVVGGHQPTLFHPGVWAKNFAMARLASSVGGIGLNLVVDNDTITSTSIRVPSGSFELPRTTDVAFDAPQPKQPWENVRVQDQLQFRSFPDRVVADLQGWDYEPLLPSFWDRVLKLQERLPGLADAFTAARSQQENAWNSGNLELPLSHLCRLPPFLWFLSHILLQLERFREIYNCAVLEYRSRNHVHSTSHPVPELAQFGDAVEAPFWVWRGGEQRRSRLFASRRGQQMILRRENGEELATISLDSEAGTAAIVEQLGSLQANGLNIRTRALTTTLFTRVCLSDLFVHGIGGAKYDEITDELIVRFFEVPVPAYWIVSGTLHLPLGSHAATAHDLFHARRHEWDLLWNPAVALSERSEQQIQELCAEFKERLLLPTTTRAERSHRHRELSRIKSGLSSWAAAEIPHAHEQVQATLRHLAANRVLENREYSSVLYPEALLRSFLHAE